MATKLKGTGSLYAKAKEALVLAAYDWAGAADILKEWVLSDNKLRGELLDRFVDRGVWEAVRAAGANQRHHFWEHRNAREDDGKGLMELAKFNISVYDYFLPGQNGKTLGDATEEDLLAAAGFHAKREQVNGERRRFFEAIRKELTKKRSKKSAVVRDVLTEKKIEQLLGWAEIEK